MQLHFHSDIPQRSRGPSHRFVTPRAGLRDLARPDVNVVVWTDAAPPPLLEVCGAWLGTGAEHDASAWLGGPGGAAAAAELLAGLPDDARWRPLAELAADLARELAAVTGVGRVKARLETVDHEICPRFHADFVVARVLCTLAGPGTEWVCNHDLLAEPRAVTGHDFAAVNRAIVDPARVRRARAGEVVALKGSAWPGQRCGGAVHKAPPVGDGQRRLVLKLDVPAASAVVLAASACAGGAHV